MKVGVTNFPDFTFSFSANPSAAVTLAKDAHFAKKITGIEVGYDHLATVIVFDKHGD